MLLVFDGWPVLETIKNRNIGPPVFAPKQQTAPDLDERDESEEGATIAEEFETAEKTNRTLTEVQNF